MRWMWLDVVGVRLLLCGKSCQLQWMKKEAARKNEEETEKLRQQGSEIQSFVRSLIGSKFASLDAQQNIVSGLNCMG
uniref:Uncharacterized protein n=1 Tax=Oryza meridionalis TaxID=40149 RepID=A0A0E0EWC9_9ORYZ